VFFSKATPPMVEYEAPVIRFRVKGKLLAQKKLTQLRRALSISCFDPETAPAESTVFDLLDFGDQFWLIPDQSADRFIFGDWAQYLAQHDAFFEGQAGTLPLSWRRSFLLIARHAYFPHAAVVPAQPMPFLQLSDPIDPRHMDKLNQQRFRRLAGEN
jgi:hypothetical protein